jgi:hypothetical protein
MSPLVGTRGAMDHHEKMRLRAAAFRVKRVYPGVAGEILAAEILSWEEFGYRLGENSRITRLVAEIMAAKVAEEAPPTGPVWRAGFVTKRVAT